MKREIPTLKVLAFVFALAGLLTLSAGVAYGQAISGNIVGTVVDSSGAAVANADVNATNINTGVGANTKTNGTGEYRFDNLLVGFYKITVKASGFRTTTVQVEVQLNASATANVTISPGAQTEVVEVSGEAPIIDTTTAQIQSTYEDKQLADLPTAAFGGALGSGVLNLSLLQSGVGTTGGLGAGSGPAVGGQRPRNNNFTIEGVDNNNKGVTGPLAYVPNDAVANFTVLQNQFDPEFGHSNGGQFNTVVLSGTNSFHGRAYEYFQNRNLNAIDQSVVNNVCPLGVCPPGVARPNQNPRFDNNRFGGQVGGPIFKNKLFFFVNYEYNPVGQVALPGGGLYQPTTQGYQDLLNYTGTFDGTPTGSPISTANVNALKVFEPGAATQVKLSNCIGPSDQTGCHGIQIPLGSFPLNAPNWLNNKALVTSMDYNLSDKDQIRGRYIYNSLGQIDTGLTGETLPIFFTTLTQPFHVIALSEYHTFSPTVSNEFRVGYNRWGYNYVVPNLSFLPTLDSFPNLTIDELGTDIGPDPNAPQYSQQNLYQAVDNITWVKGNHTFKFGGEGRRYITPQMFIQRSRGDYEYSTLNLFAFDQIPDELAERSFGSVGYSGDQYGLYWYANDIWKVRPNLSLNLGVRYEYNSTPFGWTQQSLNSIANVPGLITFGSPQAPTKDFMPRVGFAYSPGSSGNTSIRGGFGMGYDILYDNIGVLERPPQIGNTVDCPEPQCKTPFLANGAIPFEPSSGISVLDQAEARANTSAYLPNNVKYPVALSWNFGVQRVIKSNYTAEVRYVGTRGSSLNVQNRLNVLDTVTPSFHLPTYLQNPGQAALDALTTTLDGPGGIVDTYDNGAFFDPAYLLPNTSCGGSGGGIIGNCGFFSEITAYEPWGSSTYHGLQTQLNRRFTSGLQFQAAYTFSHTIDNSTADFFSTIIAPRRPQDFRDLPAERSNSILDHRHRVTLSAVYELPFNKNSSSWFMRNVLGNYEIAPIYTWESGQWGTVQSGTDSNFNTDGATDRVVVNPSGVKGTGSDVTPLTNSAGFTVAYQANNPNAQYIVAGPGALATGSRNTLATPPINNLDLTVSKHIAFTERYRMEFTFTALNSLNHPQFVTGSINQVTSISITGTTQRNYFIPNSANFNNALASWASNARQVALGVKFIF
ncbi:MAG TPA: carboxypeptidase regulatory-like domain-containing protein [Terriglobales bacterium]|nr:carboxypeptidase regulatory-like domain-containing protein [Terriglobales bacterium]